MRRVLFFIGFLHLTALWVPPAPAPPPLACPVPRAYPGADSILRKYQLPPH